MSDFNLKKFGFVKLVCCNFGLIDHQKYFQFRLGNDLCNSDNEKCKIVPFLNQLSELVTQLGWGWECDEEEYANKLTQCTRCIKSFKDCPFHCTQFAPSTIGCYPIAVGMWLKDVILMRKLNFHNYIIIACYHHILRSIDKSIFLSV